MAIVQPDRAFPGPDCASRLSIDRNGRSTSFISKGPAAKQLESDGIGHVVAAVGDAVGPVAFSSLCATRDRFKTDAARAFMRGYRKARQYVIEAPAEDIARIEAGFFPEINPAVLTATIATHQRLGCWTLDPMISRQAYENLLEVFLYNGGIARRHSYDACVVTPPDQD